MQRVAIARALVNDPDIILADEPTGALDTKTSIQIMEILKSISENKLIIMVTHNPDLAEKYSSRVIKILDGQITDDTAPFTKEDAKKEKNEAKSGKTSMSFFTALSLSLNNLMTKKGRTFLTSFAGSIGIIGIALIMSLSNGIQNYINRVEEETLTSYPITIQAESIDVSSMMEAMMGISGENDEIEKEDGKIYSRNIMTDMVSTLSSKVKSNNLKEFKRYLENDDKVINENANSIQYLYDITLNLYNPDTSKDIIQVNPSTVMDKFGFANPKDQNPMAASFTSTDIFAMLINNKSLLEAQNKLLAGRWAENYNEVVLIVDKDGYISDYSLYTLGVLDQNDLKDDYEKMQNGEEISKKYCSFI